jgi:hypothetical protein
MVRASAGPCRILVANSDPIAWDSDAIRRSATAADRVFSGVPRQDLRGSANVANRTLFSVVEASARGGIACPSRPFAVRHSDGRLRRRTVALERTELAPYAVERCGRLLPAAHRG